MGTCFETDLESCPFNYQGDGRSCDMECGACCTQEDCFNGEEFGCQESGGSFQGYGNFCESVKCPILPPTTTLEPLTTTTLPPTTTTTGQTTTTTFDETVLCGDANDDDDLTAADALIALRTSVGTGSCPKIRCDYNGNDEVQASDALGILRAAVGLPADPSCPEDV
jgi:hypothetical protein